MELKVVINKTLTFISNDDMNWEITVENGEVAYIFYNSEGDYRHTPDVTEFANLAITMPDTFDRLIQEIRKCSKNG